jgi:hypothetical protein
MAQAVTAPEPYAKSLALRDLLAAPTPAAMEEAATRAFAAGASLWEIDLNQDLWFRNRRCASCDHAVSVHDGDNCWMPACGCSSFVRPHQEASDL